MLFNQPVPDKVSVQINGQTVSNWTEASITTGIDRIPRHGSLKVTWKLNGALYSGNKPLGPHGLPITLSLGADQILVGYMDVSSNLITKDSHSITYNIRGSTCDLVDSTAEFFNQNGTLISELQGVSITNAVSKIAGVYNVNVVATNSLANSIVFPGAMNINMGDAAFTEIDYLAKFSGSLIYEDNNGNLVLGVPASEPPSSTVLSHWNVLSSGFDNDVTNIYSDYQVFAQTAASNPDVVNVTPNTAGIGYVHDAFFDNRLAANGKPRVRKYRKIQDLNLSQAIYQTNNPQQVYAQWLANRNKGRAQQMEVEVFGWRDDAGQLWRPNQLVSLNFPYQCLPPVTWLVAECTYILLYNGGTLTRLTLMPKDAFSVEPISIPMDTDIYSATYGSNSQSTLTPQNTDGGFA